MTDVIQATIDGLIDKTTDRFNAITNLTELIVDAFPGELPDEDGKMVEVYAGTLVHDLEDGRIDIDTAVQNLRDAVELAKTGDPGFVGLLQVGLE